MSSPLVELSQLPICSFSSLHRWKKRLSAKADLENIEEGRGSNKDTEMNICKGMYTLLHEHDQDAPSPRVALPPSPTTDAKSMNRQESFHQRLLREITSLLEPHHRNITQQRSDVCVHTEVCKPLTRTIAVTTRHSLPNISEPYKDDPLKCDVSDTRKEVSSHLFERSLSRQTSTVSDLSVRINPLGVPILSVGSRKELRYSLAAETNSSSQMDQRHHQRDREDSVSVETSFTGEDSSKSETSHRDVIADSEVPHWWESFNEFVGSFVSKMWFLGPKVSQQSTEVMRNTTESSRSDDVAAECSDQHNSDSVSQAKALNKELFSGTKSNSEEQMGNSRPRRKSKHYYPDESLDTQDSCVLKEDRSSLASINRYPSETSDQSESDEYVDTAKSTTFVHPLRTYCTESDESIKVLPWVLDNESSHDARRECGKNLLLGHSAEKAVVWTSPGREDAPVSSLTGAGLDAAPSLTRTTSEGAILNERCSTEALARRWSTDSLLSLVHRTHSPTLLSEILLLGGEAGKPQQISTTTESRGLSEVETTSFEKRRSPSSDRKDRVIISTPDTEFNYAPASMVDSASNDESFHLAEETHGQGKSFTLT